VDGALRPERKYPTAKSIMTFLAYFIVDAGWEWIEGDVIASPAWPLGRCAFPPQPVQRAPACGLSLEASGHTG
jgi:hypothetical protein